MVGSGNIVVVSVRGVFSSNRVAIGLGLGLGLG